jgi:hypothetical protein
MSRLDPAHLTAAQRLAELAEILAAGAMRFLANECKRLQRPSNSQDCLDVLPAVAAACGPRGHGPQSRTPA